MIEVLGREAIETALQANHRQYLAGDLKLPQDLEHLRDGEIEVGITDYAAYQWEKPHYHPLVTEYQFLLRGAAKYVDLDAGKEILVEAGDFSSSARIPDTFRNPRRAPGSCSSNTPAATTRPWCR